MNKAWDERANAPSSGPSSGHQQCGLRKSQHRAEIREKAVNRDAAVPRCFVSAVAVLIAALPAVAADAVQWGSTVNGLKMSVALSIDSTKNGEIRVTLQNLGDKDILIPLGMIVGKPHPTLLKTTLKTPDGNIPRIIYTGIGFVSGYAEAMTIGLRAGEAYTVSTPLDLYYVLDTSEKLVTFIGRRCQLWVELNVKENQCPNPTTLDPLRRTLPCWYGNVVSNVLQLPK
jgi:hypothetical protein